MVMMIAMTPSLNASSLPLPIHAPNKFTAPLLIVTPL
jgi:hypothetical protein